MQEEKKELGVNIAGVILYTIPEVAKEMNVTPQTVRSYIKKGRLNARKVGRALLVTEKDIKKFLSTTK